MTPAFAEDSAATIARLRSRLAPLAAAGRALPARSDHDLSGGGPNRAGTLAPAAVLAPLIERDGVLWVVLTERSGALSRHAGQIAFPGGRPDPEDPDLAATALREAHEEIGLDPAAVELLGVFDAYETITAYCITPFVGLIRGPFTPRPDPREVADVFEVPFAFLMDPANTRQGSRLRDGVQRFFYETPYGSRYIWGATAGLLRSLSNRLYGEAS